MDSNLAVLETLVALKIVAAVYSQRPGAQRSRKLAARCSARQ